MQKTEQLSFWCGEFGSEYMKRNNVNDITIRARIKLWSQILKNIAPDKYNSILEVGSNIGANLIALKHLTDSKMHAIEPNAIALKQLLDEGVVDKNHGHCLSSFDMNVFKDNEIDLVFTSGVLIHIHPSDLKKATDEIIRVAKKYVVCVEYFSDKEEEVNYRGHTEVLFKRDFGSFYLDNYPELTLRDYGFAWKRVMGLDNPTWWLFEKKNVT
ncbi:MAG: pseudaminic acid biosynthesis-associated methylase [Candidatus Paracaedibacter sp.]